MGNSRRCKYAAAIGLAIIVVFTAAGAKASDPSPVFYSDFDTKGYWHNKNGLGELFSDPGFATLLASINAMDPYNDPSGCFDKGEEPFDGYDEFGNPVPPAINAPGDFGLVYNEISQFLVDPIAGCDGDLQQQLAQQLLAFIFNASYRLDCQALLLVNGSWMSVGSIVDISNAAWASPTPEDDRYWATILDGLNNNDAVPFACAAP